MSSKEVNILALLRILDRKLERTERLIICGGGAIQLGFGGTRKTLDVDVLAPVPLSRSLINKVREVAAEMGVDEEWLNDAAKGYADYLPEGWKSRLVSIDVGFQNIRLQSLGKPDLIMLKLKAARERDISDVKELGITQEDVEIIVKNLERVARFDEKTSLNIQLQLKEWGFV